MIGHACVREEAVSERRVVESDLSRPETTAGAKAVCRCYYCIFWQSIPFKMAYHSPYKAPPHINAPPDQGFLWNIFQRWVSKNGLFRRCHSTPQWKLLSFVARRGRERGGEMFAWQLVFCLNSSVLKLVLALGSGRLWNEWFVSSKVKPQMWRFLKIQLHREHIQKVVAKSNCVTLH